MQREDPDIRRCGVGRGGKRGRGRPRHSSHRALPGVHRRADDGSRMSPRTSKTSRERCGSARRTNAANGAGTRRRYFGNRAQCCGERAILRLIEGAPLCMPCLVVLTHGDVGSVKDALGLCPASLRSPRVFGHVSGLHKNLPVVASRCRGRSGDVPAGLRTPKDLRLLSRSANRRACADTERGLDAMVRDGRRRAHRAPCLNCNAELRVYGHG
jgi:hypothetical protein